MLQFLVWRAPNYRLNPRALLQRPGKLNPQRSLKMKARLLLKDTVCGPLILGVIATFFTMPVHAAPSLAVTKPPVVSGPNPNTGPAPLDPHAKQGQWFFFQPPGTNVVAIEKRAY